MKIGTLNEAKAEIGIAGSNHKPQAYSGQIFETKVIEYAPNMSAI